MLQSVTEKVQKKDKTYKGCTKTLVITTSLNGQEIIKFSGKELRVEK